MIFESWRYEAFNIGETSEKSHATKMWIYRPGFRAPHFGEQSIETVPSDGLYKRQIDQHTQRPWLERWTERMEVMY